MAFINLSSCDTKTKDRIVGVSNDMTVKNPGDQGNFIVSYRREGDRLIGTFEALLHLYSTEKKPAYTPPIVAEKHFFDLKDGSFDIEIPEFMR